MEESTPNTKETIIHISALREALRAPSMSPPKYRELTCDEKIIATIPGIRQHNTVHITDHTRYVGGIGSAFP